MATMVDYRGAMDALHGDTYNVAVRDAAKVRAKRVWCVFDSCLMCV
jgi:hypothetical protein